MDIGRWICHHFLLSAVLLLAACSSPAVPEKPKAQQRGDAAPAPELSLPPLPADRQQPFDRSALAAPAAVFSSGNEFFQTGGATEALGRCLELDGGMPGGRELSFAIYRLSMGSAQPGSLTVDANILPGVLGSGREIYVAVSDYGRGRWRWLAPAAGNHSIYSLADSGAELLSSAGSLFVVVAVFGGTDCQIVGVGADPLASADSSAPSAPTSLTLLPRSGALELSWDAAADSDLAGYRVMWSDSFFFDGDGLGVRELPLLCGAPRCLLSITENLKVSSEIHVRVFAVDHSGNQSPPSPLAVARRLSGTVPPFVLLTETPAVSQGASAMFSCSGAETFDIDSTADGTFELEGQGSGNHPLDASTAGISRNMVRAIDGTDTVALAGLSLLVSENSAPVATADASPLKGKRPLKVFFEGTASDNEDALADLSFAWDFDGDGLFEDGTNSLEPPPYTYTEAGDYTARLRVTDSGGATATAEIEISVRANLSPVASLSADPLEGAAPLMVSFDASGSTDEDGYVKNYQWDWEGDGEIDFNSEEDSVVTHEYSAPGLFDPVVTITDNNGAAASATVQIGVKGWTLLKLESDGTVGQHASLQEIDGNPAVLCDYFFIDANFSMIRRFLYVRSSTELGLRRTDWSLPVLIEHSPRQHPMALLETEGRPLLLAAGGSGSGEGMLVGRSSTAHGTLLADWNTFFTVPSGDGHSRSLSGSLIAGNPAVSFTGASGALYFLRSDTAAGGGASDWGQPMEVAGAGASYVSTSLCVVDGAPAIAWADVVSGDLNYARSGGETGMSGEDWPDPLVLFDGPDSSGTQMWPSLALVAGKPCISFHDEDAKVLRFASSSGEDGAAFEDWSISTADGEGPTGQYSSLAEYEGLPAISYYHVATQDLRLARSSTQSGSDPADWTVETIDSKDLVGQYSSLKVFGGVPRIAYYHVSSLDLRYAVLFE